MATNNAINTPKITLGGTFTMSGAFSFTGNITGITNITYPTSGTLATIAQITDQTAVNTITFGNGGALRTGTSAANTFLLQAYDVDGASYATFATLTANNTPTMDLSTSTTIGGAGIATSGANTNITSLTGINFITMANTGGLQTGTTNGNVAYLLAYNTLSASYQGFLTLTAGNPPTCNLETTVTIGGNPIANGGANTNITSLGATNFTTPGTTKGTANTAGHAGVTGNTAPTVYTCVFELPDSNNIGSVYNSSTGEVTTDKAGMWIFCGGLSVSGVAAGNTSGSMYIRSTSTTPAFAQGLTTGAPFVISGSSGALTCTPVMLGYFPAGAVVRCIIDFRGNATNNVNLASDSFFSWRYLG